MALYLSTVGGHEDTFCHLHGTWSIETIDVALRAGNGIHRPTIVDESYSSHDKEKEQSLLLCIVLNLGVSKLSSYRCSKFICCTQCMALYLSTVGGHEDTFAIWNLEYVVALRNGKFTYCRLQIVYESCSSHA